MATLEEKTLQLNREKRENEANVNYMERMKIDLEMVKFLFKIVGDFNFIFSENGSSRRRIATRIFRRNPKSTFGTRHEPGRKTGSDRAAAGAPKQRVHDGPANERREQHAARGGEKAGHEGSKSQTGRDSAQNERPNVSSSAVEN